MNIHTFAESLRQQLLDAAHRSYQQQVAEINRLFTDPDDANVGVGDVLSDAAPVEYHGGE